MVITNAKRMKKGLGVIPVLLMAVGSPAMADESTGFLFGIGGGQVNYDVKDVEQIGVDLGFDEETSAWSIFAGWRINKYFTIEGAYIDGGSVGGSVGPINFRYANEEVLQASVTGGWWFNDYVGVYARLAENMYDTEVTATLAETGESVSVRDDGHDTSYGGGVQAMWDGALLRLEYQTGDFPGADVRAISLSIGWQF